MGRAHCDTLVGVLLCLLLLCLSGHHAVGAGQVDLLRASQKQNADNIEVLYYADIFHIILLPGSLLARIAVS